MSFSEGGTITFNGSVADGGSADVRFRLEFNPHPNVDPSYDAETVTVSGASPTSYTVNIPSQGSNTFSSMLMYVMTQDVGVTITDVVVEIGTSVENPAEPEDHAMLEFMGNFGGAIIEIYETQVFTFPAEQKVGQVLQI